MPEMRTPAPVHRIPVALVDDHALLRNMLANMIGSMPAYEVVLEAANGAELVKAMESTDLRVSVAVVDLHMPVMDGYETIGWLRTHHPATRSLALTFERTQQAMERSLQAGACGFILKDVGYEEFKDALDQVATVGHYHNKVILDPPIVAEPVQEKLQTPIGKPLFGDERPRSPSSVSFTERERAFVQLACDLRELTYDQIAEEMEVHRRTVDGYRDAVFTKLNVKTRAGMVLCVLQWGLVEQ